MNVRRAAPAALCGALLLAGCSSGFGSDSSSKQDSEGKQHLTVMIGSSGDAETNAVKAAAAAWAKKTGNTVTVTAAQNLDQQLGQSLAGGKPPDVFYVGSNTFANYAKGNSLYTYGDQLSYQNDFSDSLRKSFSYNGKFVCAPKDTSTLALAVNTAMWQKAGLTAADYPTTWPQLEKVAKKLTSSKVTGLVVDASYNELGVFMKQAGGWITDPGQAAMTADSAANVKALTFVKKLLKEGALKYPKQVDTGWGGEALGTQKAAMTIEGNWLTGAMASDYPKVGYKVLPLPVGSAGKGTLSFSTCWGIANKSAHHAADVSLVKAFTAVPQELTFAGAYGVLPSRTSALAAYSAKYPANKAFADGESYGQGPVTLPGFTKVLAQFDTDLAGLATADPKTILSSLQKNGTAALGSGG
ncbi:carbohydrate ABC transporter substrate-binding protein, CUT1 family [Actinacidiphila yanglinensis]|uniref:Carbohydrate ABC transporter substrate-binding protein, CUT1 family n=1 Tax=Actinacidiphila yanglinensis TaxID=310779 RepID=A0A1H5ZXV1_9ACTN|nr:ABC transporter substrate-binding protein [Actinacidiphila yanglinensis]SEG40517.1 carbohydrate ABC transporter substrate-binding protein, CUT1 family [Actinacidiphila yanglinensis]